MGFLGSLVSAGMNLFSARSAQKAQERANEQNIEQSQEAREWAERMSSTAHQREVNDLRAAGLNPILSANSGASTPAAPVAHVESTNRDSTAVLSQSVSSALAAASTAAQIKVAESQATLNNAQADRLSGGRVGIPGIGEINASSIKPFLAQKTSKVVSSARSLSNFLRSDRLTAKEKLNVLLGKTYKPTIKNDYRRN